ncbi:MAG: O-antigen ligase family protein [Parcubacteria group bacterium]|nr:O-antigen ligase family protein [Parcubacteria group bacterium]
MKNWEYYLKTIIKYGIYAVLFTPLIYTNFTFYPFIVGKTLFFRTVIEIIFALYVILAVAYPAYRPKKSLLFSAVLIYSGISILATLFSVDPLRSFWSNQERMMGLWTLLHAMMLFFVAGNIFKTKKEWRSVFGVSVWASILVGGLGIYQYFSDGFLHAEGGGRVYSTLGNFIYFGGYGLFHAIIAAIFFLEEKIKKSLVGSFWLLGIAIGLISVYLSGTRGVLVAFCAAIFLVCVLHALFYPSKKIRLVFASVMILAVMVSGGLWLSKESSFVQNNYLLASFLDISITASTGQTRLINWAVGFEAWKQHPILGWGPDTYFIAFNKNYNPKIFEFGTYETWQDHAHNIVIDTLNESGIVGLMSYLSIFVVAFYLIFRSVKRKKLKFSSGVLLFSVLSAYFVQNLFVFDTLTLLMLFYVVLAFVYAMDAHKESDEDKHELSDFVKKLDPVYRNALVGVFLISIVSLIYFTSFVQLRASAMTLGALKSFNQNFLGSVETLREASSMNSPYLQETRDELSKIITMAIQAGVQLPQEKVKEILLVARDELEKSVEEHPLDLYHWNYLGQWYFTLAQVFGDEYYFEESKKAIDRAMELGPKRQNVHFTLGRYHIIRGEYDKAIEVFSAAVDLAPKVRESHWGLGLAYAYAKDLENAYVEFEFAREHSISPTNKLEVLTALEAYVFVGDIEGINWLHQKVDNIAPGPFEYAKFAGAFKKLGDLERSEEFRQAALGFNPSLEAQIDEIINNY